jgi:hypothetical protein
MSIRQPVWATLVALISWSTWAYSEQAAARPTSAGASLVEHFDTTKPVTVSGIVHGIAWETRSPYVFIAIAVDNKETGTREVRWALRGDTREALQRAGWLINPKGSDSTVQPGSRVSATAYPARPKIDLDAAIPGAPPMMLQAAKAGGLMHGIEITRVNDGKTFYFGPRK